MRPIEGKFATSFNGQHRGGSGRLVGFSVPQPGPSSSRLNPSGATRPGRFPPSVGPFHPTGHATGEPCAARSWQPMFERAASRCFFRWRKSPYRRREKINAAQRPAGVCIEFFPVGGTIRARKNIRFLPGPHRPI